MAESASGLNIVAIGGGTGLSIVLSGLKHSVGSGDGHWIGALTAVVTVTDDGGSSGRLREEFQILPPGDIRNCLVALAEDERLLTRLFQHRFKSDGHLSGHSFGNIFLAALTGVTGDFLEAVKVTSEVLAIKGRIYPSTRNDVALVAELEDGRIVQGETRIVSSRSTIRRLTLSQPDCQPLPETLDAIREADLITIGPGSLYTSVIPTLLVKGITEAINDSRALKVYICNIMTQPGETDDFGVEEHLKTLLGYGGNLQLDYVIVNSTPVTPSIREKYLADGAVQVTFGQETNKGGREPGNLLASDRSPGLPSFISADLLSEADVVRHDPYKLANLLLQLQRSELSQRLAAAHRAEKAVPPNLSAEADYPRP